MKVSAHEVTLKKSVILKKVKDDLTYAVDISKDDQVVYKFQDASSFFIVSLEKKLSRDEIIKSLSDVYDGVDAEKANQDYDNFLKMVKEFKLIED